MTLLSSSQNRADYKTSMGAEVHVPLKRSIQIHGEQFGSMVAATSAGGDGAGAKRQKRNDVTSNSAVAVRLRPPSLTKHRNVATINASFSPQSTLLQTPSTLKTWLLNLKLGDFATTRASKPCRAENGPVEEGEVEAEVEADIVYPPIVTYLVAESQAFNNRGGIGRGVGCPGDTGKVQGCGGASVSEGANPVVRNGDGDSSGVGGWETASVLIGGVSGWSKLAESPALWRECLSMSSSSSSSLSISATSTSMVPVVEYPKGNILKACADLPSQERAVMAVLWVFHMTATEVSSFFWFGLCIFLFDLVVIRLAFYRQ